VNAGNADNPNFRWYFRNLVGATLVLGLVWAFPADDSVSWRDAVAREIRAVLGGHAPALEAAVVSAALGRTRR
jgi:hypothetical protein